MVSWFCYWKKPDKIKVSYYFASHKNTHTLTQTLAHMYTYTKRYSRTHSVKHCEAFEMSLTDSQAMETFKDSTLSGHKRTHRKHYFPTTSGTPTPANPTNGNK